MKKSQTELTYLRVAAQNASAVGLVIILYDLLVADLERAIAAIAERDIEKRSKEISHALLVLQQLEGSLDMEKGGEPAKNFSRFYSVLRSRVLEAQIKVSAETLRQQIELIQDVRKAWQQVENPNLSAAAAAAGPGDGPAGQRSMAASASGDRTASSMNWTA